MTAPERGPLRPPCSECGDPWSAQVWHQEQTDERAVCRSCWLALWDQEHAQ